MLPGRRRFILTSEERKAIRRQKVRSYVQAHRQRKKERQAAQSREQEEAQEGSSEESTNRAGASLTETFEAFSEFEPRKHIFHIPRPTTNDDHRFPINLPFKIDLGPLTPNTFLAVFPAATSPLTPTASFEGGSRNIQVAIHFSSWGARFSYNVDSAESQVLNDAIVGLALNFISTEHGNSDGSVRALDLLTMSLTKLRDGFDAYLQDRGNNNFYLLSATALVFAASELFVNKSWQNFSQHISGIGALLEHHGAALLSDVAFQDYTFGFRSGFIAISLMNRRSTFLSRTEWCFFPGRKEHKLGKDPFHTLLDIAYQIPSHMEALDNMQERHGGPSFLSWLKSKMQDLIAIESQLDLWAAALPETYQQTHFATVPSVWSVSLEAFEFCTPHAATCFTFYVGLKITVENLLVQVIRESKKYEYSPDRALRDKVKESYNWSRVVCQCLEYFFERGRNLAGEAFALYSFTAAWENFTRLGRHHGLNMERELSWCRETANKLKDLEYGTLGNWILVVQSKLVVDEALSQD